ncbi:MAG: hypothetical protein U0223_07915 [Nitrospira sp.]|nr:hypothetical protein [Nitrospira sp.]
MRHPSDAINQQNYQWVEEAFGCLKTAGFRYKVKLRGESSGCSPLLLQSTTWYGCEAL